MDPSRLPGLLAGANWRIRKGKRQMRALEASPPFEALAKLLECYSVLWSPAWLEVLLHLAA